MIVDISKVQTVSLEQIAEITGWDIESFRDDIKESGVYRMLSGSRGIYDEVELVGSLEDKNLYLKDKEACVEFFLDEGYSSDEFDEMTEYVEEWYTIEVNKDNVQFCFTEEEFDYFFRVAL